MAECKQAMLVKCRILPDTAVKSPESPTSNVELPTPLIGIQRILGGSFVFITGKLSEDLYTFTSSTSRGNPLRVRCAGEKFNVL